MKTIIYSLAIIFLASCATNQKASKSEPVINISQELMSNPDEIGFWLLYSLALPVCAKKHNLYSLEQLACSYRFGVGFSPDAESVQNSKIYKDLKPMVEKGLLKEYLWTNLRQDWWFIPKDLRLEEYRTYVESNPLIHTPNQSNGVDFQPGNSSELVYNSDIYDRTYPSNVGKLIFEKYIRLDANEGHKLTYAHKEDSNMQIDLYIYASNTDHANNSTYKFAEELATSVKLPIYYYSQRGLYGPIKLINESYVEIDGIPSPIAEGIYEYQSQLGESRSIFFITYAKGMLIKIRASTKQGQSHSKDDFVTLIREIIKRLN